MSSEENNNINNLRRLFNSNWFFPPKADPENHRVFYDKVFILKDKITGDMNVELDYAYRHYDEKNETFGILDMKSKMLFQFSAVSAGVLLTAAKAFTIGISFCFFIPMILFVLGLILPLRAMLSADKTTSANIKNIAQLRLDVDNEYPDDKVVENHMKSILIASMHTACMSMTIVTNWKADQNDRSAILIILGLIASVIWLGLS